MPRGTKRAYKQAQGTREHFTVLACLNAAGEDVPPFIIYKGGYPGGPYNKEGVPDALYGKSPAGYMDSELFRKWFVGHFLKFAAQERPLLLIMDGHQSHLDPELVRAAQREGVILLCLPPHTSHILQPLDVSFFGPLKANFSGVTGDLLAVSHSFLVSKKEFSRVLRDSYQRVKDRRLVVAGFRRCGLYPLDPMAIDWSRVMPSGPRCGASSPPPPTPSASSWAVPDVALPSQHPLSPAQPAPIPNPQNQPPPAPPPPNPYIIHPLVISGRITVDLAHLLAEINYNRNTGKVRRNNTKARLLTAQEMSDVIVEAEDRAARREAQVLARRDREQQRAGDTGPAATSSTLSAGSRPSRRRPVSLGAASATSSGLSITGPSSCSAPSCASHGPRLPVSRTTSPPSLPAEGHHHLPPSPEPSTSAAGHGLYGSQTPSSPSHPSQPAQTRPSSSSSSAGPTTSTVKFY
ncbi:uncharacterized protein [Cebidichthys violaceus]|uniref:uncharacterized protein isoform X2 n=1 Tax=Cebidichthys violaceus TaxID=271503 RepID=UPI0035C962F5